MDLFNQNPMANLLPYEGTVILHGNIYTIAEANTLFKTLFEEIEWENDQAYIMGKHIITKRKVAWYANESYDYTYSNVTKRALVWTPTLLKIKEKVEQTTGLTFNSCLLNLYHDGSEGMAWHSDNEKALRVSTDIASVSFGAERKFSFKHKTSKEKIDVFLSHGSLLMMQGTTQEYWLHRLPPTKKVQKPRINLTFRTIQYTN
ncbi:alpha-ketoglutarate-dependent dioxygenase AlkB [Putridiphycobacter roseus]|uniref:Alpha-ketoglutarate-dependent dioxygenase AlkB n=1 Tax=Putridiphycobacter roseus TaxID=2219161 RepID=A0A2W1MVV3_9FLAO|nr:alpha-ketoglutarate-dependent dioxygenase AlkB [Putridiphycobacter roseus]PZE15957.1 alpha-ketoglutarate-dependent dioxygenase AlkB [Putridiphycobacter roseus]